MCVCFAFTFLCLLVQKARPDRLYLQTDPTEKIMSSPDKIMLGLASHLTVEKGQQKIELQASDLKIKYLSGAYSALDITTLDYNHNAGSGSGDADDPDSATDDTADKLATASFVIHNGTAWSVSKACDTTLDFKRDRITIDVKNTFGDATMFSGPGIFKIKFTFSFKANARSKDEATAASDTVVEYDLETEEAEIVVVDQSVLLPGPDRERPDAWSVVPLKNANATSVLFPIQLVGSSTNPRFYKQNSTSLAGTPGSLIKDDLDAWIGSDDLRVEAQRLNVGLDAYSMIASGIWEKGTNAFAWLQSSTDDLKDGEAIRFLFYKVPTSGADVLLAATAHFRYRKDAASGVLELVPSSVIVRKKSMLEYVHKQLYGTLDSYTAALSTTNYGKFSLQSKFVRMAGADARALVKELAVSSLHTVSESGGQTTLGAVKAFNGGSAPTLLDDVIDVEVSNDFLEDRSEMERNGDNYRNTVVHNYALQFSKQIGTVSPVSYFVTLHAYRSRDDTRTDINPIKVCYRMNAAHIVAEGNASLAIDSLEEIEANDTVPRIYVDQKVDELMESASDAIATLKNISEIAGQNPDVTQAIVSGIADIRSSVKRKLDEDVFAEFKLEDFEPMQKSLKGLSGEKVQTKELRLKNTGWRFKVEDTTANAGQRISRLQIQYANTILNENADSFILGDTDYVTAAEYVSRFVATRAPPAE